MISYNNIQVPHFQAIKTIKKSETYPQGLSEVFGLYCLKCEEIMGLYFYMHVFDNVIVYVFIYCCDKLHIIYQNEQRINSACVFLKAAFFFEAPEPVFI